MIGSVEKYFIVDSNCKLCIHYYEALKFKQQIREVYRSFSDEHGIEADIFFPESTKLGIVPTQADEEKFKAVLCKYPDIHGIRYFKSTSYITKLWVCTFKSSGLKCTKMPVPLMYYTDRSLTGGQHQLIDINGVLYYRQLSAHDFNTPEFCTEIKGSEFMSILEARGD